MANNVTVNATQFMAAIAAVGQVTKRDSADIINRALRNVAFKAAGNTPFRTPAEITASAMQDNRLIKMVSKRMRGSSRAAIRAAAKKILARRRSGSRAERAGWIPSVQHFGGNFRGARLKPGGAASRGFARSATPSQLFGQITNAYFNRLTGKGAGKSSAGMINALQNAVNTVAAENFAYARNKILRTLLRHSS